MSAKRYTLDNLNELILEKKEIGVVDRITGEEKIVKTVQAAEIATIVAYMAGIDDEKMENYYSHHYSSLLKLLYKNKAATSIRYLSKIRTAFMKHFLSIDNEMRYNLSNLDKMEYFDKKELMQLISWGIPVLQANYRSDKYMICRSKVNLSG